MGQSVLESACDGYCAGGVNDDEPCLAETDCPGGSCNLPSATSFCACACLDEGGSPAPVGGLRCDLGAQVFIDLNSPCDDVDLLFGDFCIPLTTGSSTGQILNANGVPGLLIPDPSASTQTGQPVSCTQFATTGVSGLVLGTQLSFLGSAFGGDIQAEATFVCE